MSRAAATIQAEIDLVRAEAANAAASVRTDKGSVDWRTEDQRQKALRALEAELGAVQYLAGTTPPIRQIRLYSSKGL